MENLKQYLHQKLLDKLDMERETSDQELTRLIDDMLTQESRNCYLPLWRKNQLRKELFDSLRGLDVLTEILEEEGITEIMVNGPDHIFIEKDGRVEPYEKSFSTKERLEDVVQQIAARVNRRVNEVTPMVDARLEDGSRVNVVLEPVALGGPIVTIRRFSGMPIQMKDLVEWGTITEDAAHFLKILVQSKCNLFVSGGTGAGKTTFLGALAEYIFPGERVITIEDSAELRLINQPNLVRLEARTANLEGKNEITIRDLIRNSLRMRPDQILLGEIRSQEALDMLMAMNTGHNGSFSTGHANSCRDMISRIETMVLMGMELPLPAIRGQIASALDFMIHLGRLRDGSRRVLAIEEVTGMAEGEVGLNLIYEFMEEGEENGKIRGRLIRTSNRVECSDKFRAAGYGL